MQEIRVANVQEKIKFLCRNLSAENGGNEERYLDAMSNLVLELAEICPDEILSTFSTISVHNLPEILELLGEDILRKKSEAEFPLLN